MRISPEPTGTALTRPPAATSNRRFFEDALAEAGRAPAPASILLVGGTDTASIAVRHAQAATRLDRRTSPWSHAALIVAWDHDDVGASIGLEVTLDPETRIEQVPERNGVTPFRLGRYLDEARYPNVAISFATFEEDDPAERVARLRAALANPNLDRLRFPFWEQLGAWSRLAYAPAGSTNPLLENVPMPAASFCEYVYDAAGVDLTPGATGNYSSPDVLYATMKHWSESVKEADGVAFRTWALVRQDDAVPAPKLDADFAALLGAAEGKPKAKSEARTKSKKPKKPKK